MDDYESLSHTTWTCKYHGCSFRSVGARRCIRNCAAYLGEIFRKLALRRFEGSHPKAPGFAGGILT
jgi:hypothetical protein